MIPKIIHYIWIGERKKPIDRINSWKGKLSDFEFREWNESNLDLDKYQFSRLGYDLKKYGAAIDPYRVEILYQYGGVWFDTDIIVHEDISCFLENDLFAGFSYWNETNKIWTVGMGIIGVSINHPIMKELRTWYENNWTKVELKNVSTLLYERIYQDHFPHPEILLTRILQKKYVLKPNGVTQKTNRIQIESIPVFTIRGDYGVKNYTEHLYEGSWLDKPVDRYSVLEKQYRVI
jgi:hypothetical protein